MSSSIWKPRMVYKPHITRHGIWYLVWNMWYGIYGIWYGMDRMVWYAMLWYGT
jgi:hypothetical protein